MSAYPIPAIRRKRWTVIYMDRNGRVMGEATDYYLTRWGARRRVRSLGPSPLWTARVMRCVSSP